MTLDQQVGQLFVAGVNAARPTPSQLDMISTYHLGGVILTGGSSAGVSATHDVTARARAKATTTDGVGLWVSADQEGGQVQQLRGPGFDTMPTALDQGAEDPGTLKSDARAWGRQLSQAGVNLDLAPVMDTVPADLGTANKPIGFYGREYGHTPDAVTDHGSAFLAGMTAAGVQTTVKHFPGLGRVRGNTDTDTGVVDGRTTRGDAYLAPFRAAVTAGAPLVMVSTATYSRIDPDHQAAFSSTVMNHMLRGDLGFKGVIISDDLGSAASVRDIPVADRAVNFLASGGTVALTVSSGDLPTMYRAVVDRAESDAGFRATVRSAAQHVLSAKSSAGLLACD